MKPVHRLATSAFLATGALVGVLAAGAVRVSLALQVYALALAALVALALVRLTRSAHPLAPRTPLGLRLRRRRREPLRPPELESVERVVAIAAEDAFFAQRRLAPILREIAEHRLARRGASLESDRGRELLGPTVTGVLERRGQGPVPLEELQACLDELERL